MATVQPMQEASARQACLGIDQIAKLAVAEVIRLPLNNNPEAGELLQTFNYLVLCAPARHSYDLGLKGAPDYGGSRQ